MLLPPVKTEAHKHSMQLARKHLRNLALLALVIIPLSACSTLGYYWQAASGHLAIMHKQQPINEALAQPGIDDKRKQQLELAQRARDFASQVLLLPENDSYRRFADLGRPFAVWNVVAAPELSVTAEHWCFLFVGCVSYRGYFAKEDAEALAGTLRTQGMDVYVGGVAAYSTLGYFDDPLLSTMLKQDEAALVGLIFHELSHQLVYIKGDSEFNEAFATAVEQEGVRRWFLAKGQAEPYQRYVQELQFSREFYQLLRGARAELKQCYASTASSVEKRAQKQALLIALKNHYQQWKAQSKDTRFDRWMEQDLNNAHLALVATYHEQVPAFMALLVNQKGDLAAFYQAVKELAELEKGARHARLDDNLSGSP
jgi:predicted aminopeptidase